MFKLDAHKKVTDEVADRGTKWLRSKHAGSFLALISFVESVFAPIITDPFLIAMILAKPSLWRRYTVIAIVASVVGGVCAYTLGALFFDTLGSKLISLYHLESVFANISTNVNNSGFVFVLIGAFTPIPYKLVAIASGLLQIHFLTFLVASTVGRILRLGLVAVAVHTVGPHALPIIRKHLYTIAAVSGIILIVYIVLQTVFV